MADPADEREFAAIYARHWNGVFRYVERRVGYSSAKAVTSDVFLDAWKKRAKLMSIPPAQQIGWLVTAAKFSVSQHRRGDSRRQRALPRLDVDVGPSLEDGVVGRLGAASSAETLYREMTDGEREFVDLYVQCDGDYELIASLLDIEVGAARTRMFRLRGRFRQLFGLVGEHA